MQCYVQSILSPAILAGPTTGFMSKILIREEGLGLGPQESNLPDSNMYHQDQLEFPVIVE
ncbi:hypothetical protein GH733_009909 [Mirounga leonina]|nr:hypothetical protein GH733_009909 [Mirounga leonina]